MGCSCSSNDENQNIIPQKRKSKNDIAEKKVLKIGKSTIKKEKLSVKQNEDEIENGYFQDKEEVSTNEMKFNKNKIKKTSPSKNHKNSPIIKKKKGKEFSDSENNHSESKEEIIKIKRPKKRISNSKQNKIQIEDVDERSGNQIVKNKSNEDDEKANLNENKGNRRNKNIKNEEDNKENRENDMIKNSLSKESQNNSKNDNIIKDSNKKEDIENDNLMKEQSKDINNSKNEQLESGDEMLNNEKIINQDVKQKTIVNEVQEIKEIKSKSVQSTNKIEENQGSQEQKKEGNNNYDEGEEKEEGTGNYDPLLIICPYLGSIISPSQIPNYLLKEPSISYELFYVYGYRSEDSRMNLYYTSNDKIVYPSSSIGIVFNLKTNSQEFFGGKTYHSKNQNNKREDHDRDIISLAISSNKSFVATGQMGTNCPPKIFIWEIETCKLKTSNSKITFSNNSKGISAIGISLNNKYIACADLSDKHAYYLFEIDSGREIFKKEAGPDKICDIKWNEEEDFFCVGVRNAFFVNINQNVQKGSFKDFPETNFACLVYVPKIKKFYAGGSNGKIYVWRNPELLKVLNAHNQIIQVISFVNENIISGSNDHSLKICDFEGSLIKEMKLSTIPKAIDFNGTEFVIGGLNGSIYTCSHDLSNFKEIVSSHSSGELWGLEIFEDKVITSGEDNQIKVYNYNTRNLLLSSEISNSDHSDSKKNPQTQSNPSRFPEDQCSRSVKINRFSRELIIGTMDGKIQVRNFDNLILKYNIKTSFDKGILSAEISPDGKLLAVGSENSNVYLFDINEGYQEKITLKGLGAVRSLEWNEESTFLRSNTSRKCIYYYNIKTNSVENNGHIATRDQKWFPFSNTLRWGVEGILRRKENPEFVNCICKHPKLDVIFSGNNAGFIEIYNYPCKENAERIILTGHSEKVVKIMTDQSGDFLFSIGGKDNTLMQWKIIS